MTVDPRANSNSSDTTVVDSSADQYKLWVSWDVRISLLILTFFTQHIKAITILWVIFLASSFLCFLGRKAHAVDTADVFYSSFLGHLNLGVALNHVLCCAGGVDVNITPSSIIANDRLEW